MENIMIIKRFCINYKRNNYNIKDVIYLLLTVYL